MVIGWSKNVTNTLRSQTRELFLTDRLRLRKTFGFAAFLVICFGAVGCTDSFQGEYSDPMKMEIVDDKWNETDARTTAEHMIKGMLERPWLGAFKKKQNRKPIVVVDDIENRTDEHLDTQALTEFISDELINSGAVRFVDKKRRQQLLQEIKYQQSGNVSQSTAKQGGRQIGADYMLVGAITSSVHTMDELKTVTYQTTLRLTNIETFELEWSNKKLIKKRFKRSGAGW